MTFSVLIASSRKQKICMKDSTKAGIVLVSYYIHRMKLLRDFLSDKGEEISSAIILDLIITSPKVKTKLQVPMCEKLLTQMYRENNSIHIFNIQNDKKFSFEPLMMMDLCKIWKLWNPNWFTISRSTAQPSCKVALWLGNRQNLGHSGFSLHQNVPFFISQFHCIWSIWAPSKTM